MLKNNYKKILFILSITLLISVLSTALFSCKMPIYRQLQGEIIDNKGYFSFSFLPKTIYLKIDKIISRYTNFEILDNHVYLIKNESFSNLAKPLFFLKEKELSYFSYILNTIFHI